MNQKHKFLTTLMIAGLISTGFAHADTARKHKKTTTTTTQDTPDYVDPAYQDPAMIAPHQEQQQSVAQDINYKEDATLRDETFAITPQVGAISFTNTNGAFTSKALAGLGLSLNLAPYMLPTEQRNWYMGVSTGGLYSHNGSSSGNFFGANSDINDRDNSNMILIPVDLKIGYNLTPAFRVSAHGGGNLIYRSNGNSMFLGDSTVTNDSVWRMYPDAGADFEFQASRNVSILLRPDVTITPGNDALSVTLGANIINL